MYEWPTTQPMSEAVNITSPAPTPYTLDMLHFRATAWPPWSRATPLGIPVVPDVYRM